jgi:RNA-directed DNA polymerase
MTGQRKDEYLENLEKESLPEGLSRLRQKLYQKAKNEPKFRFYTLYGHLLREDVLRTAWKLVKRNKGAAGLDRVRIEDVDATKEGVEEFLNEIRNELQTRKYKPGPVRRVYIPKPQGGERPLGIPNLRDRVVQAALRLILEPIFEADFKECSYGFRPNRSTHDALQEVRTHLENGFRQVYDIDIKGYFDNIPHDKLMTSIKVRISDPAVIKLVEMWLTAPIVEKSKEGSSTGKRPTQGTPQGGVISPLLANVYLHWMDKRFHSINGPARWANAKMVRYADDMVIFARYVGSRIQDFVSDTLETRLGLTLSPTKTKVLNLNEAGVSLDFLGFTFRMDRDLKGRAHRYLNIEPSKKALKRERTRLREMTSSSLCFKPIKELIEDINHHLQSWKPYYNFGYPRKAFRSINRYTRDRLTIHLRRRSQRPCRPPPEVTYYEHLGKLGLLGL